MTMFYSAADTKYLERMLGEARAREIANEEIDKRGPGYLPPGYIRDIDGSLVQIEMMKGPHPA